MSTLELLLENKQKERQLDQDFKFLLDHGADIHYRDEMGRTLLMAAVENRNEKAVKYLIKQNIDINETENIGWTALIIAAYGNQANLVKLLLQHPDIDVNIKDQYDKTALSYAYSKDRHETVALLKQYAKEKGIRLLS